MKRLLIFRLLNLILLFKFFIFPVVLGSLSLEVALLKEIACCTSLRDNSEIGIFVILIYCNDFCF